jgi:transcriptional regulator with XRE-family HTH domain
VSVSPSPDAARRRLQTHGIKDMPSGYDAEVAELFRDLRAASNLSETDLAQRLGTRVEVVQALEQGALYALPPWPETCRIVNGYGALLNLDIRPLLRRIYAQLEAGIVQLGPKTIPEMPVLHPPEDADFEVDRPTAAPSAKNSQWPGPSQQSGQNAWPQQAQQQQTAPWPPAMPQQPPQQQAPWPGYPPQLQPQPQQPAWPNGGQQGMPQQSWQSAPQPQPQPQARPDGQAQQRPAQTYAQQPQAQPQAQAPQPQPQQQPAPQEQPQLAAPAAKTKPQKPERAARSSAWLLKWGLGALVVSVVAFGLWIAFGDPSATLGGKSLGPSGSGQVLDPDDPRSRKADKLPSAF